MNFKREIKAFTILVIGSSKNQMKQIYLNFILNLVYARMTWVII